VQPAHMIDVDDIRLRYRQPAGVLDEPGRRLFGANEALAHGDGGCEHNGAGDRMGAQHDRRGVVQRLSGGETSAPGCVVAARAQECSGPSAGFPIGTGGSDPRTPSEGIPATLLRWVSRSLRHLVKALAAQGVHGEPHRVVANLLRELRYSCQSNRKTREGSNHPDRSLTSMRR
jgi:hypothetical protein